MDIEVPKLLGGVANGQDVPPDWSMVSEWRVPGTDLKSIYEKRAFLLGSDRFLVWTDITLSDQAFQTVMFWHRETHRSELLSSQREVLREGMEAAKRYNEVITAIGFAGLFALWTQLKSDVTPLTSLAAILLIVVALVAFVGLELFGMVVRARSNLSLARSLTAPDANAMSLLQEHRKNIHGFVLKYRKIWGVGVFIAISAGASAGIVLLSAIIHGAWILL